MLGSLFFLANPRKAVLCLILSLAFGIALLIIYMLIFACCARFKKKNLTDSASDVAKDETDGVKQILISSPKVPDPVPADTTYETVLVTRQNGVALHETTISSDSTLLTRKSSKKGGNHGHAEVISTIKRTHSVDEGTQTDNEDMDDTVIERAPRTLSVQEANELGDLVDVMNYYNSRIDDDNAFYPQFSDNFKSRNERKNEHEKEQLLKSDSYQNQSKQREPENKYNSHTPSPVKYDRTPSPVKYNDRTSTPDKYRDKYYYANRGPSFEDEGRSSSNMSSSTPDRQPLLPHNNSAPIPPSPYHLRNKLPEQKSLSRNPSELSYTTSASNASDSSLGNYSPDAIFNGDNIRHNSIQRTPKPGVRGDGFEFIVNSSRSSYR